MAQEPSSTSSSQTLDSSINHDDIPSTITSTSSDSNSNRNSNSSSNPSLTRNVSSSRLNAKAPEFVPRTTADTGELTQPRIVISPPPTSPGIIHVYPSPNSPFHAPIPTHVPVTVPIPVENHHGHHHHHHHHPHPHHVPVQYHHHNHNNNHNHQRPFNGGGTGFLDQKDVAVQAQRTVHGGDPELKDGLTDEATQKIINQVEYYFSDINLATTDHLMRFIHKDPEGYVPISVVVSFKKIKALVSGNAQLASILRSSGKLVVSEDGKKVKRQHPLTESDMEELQSRIIVAENLPEDHSHQNLMKIFSAVGSVKTIRTCQPQASNGGPSSASRTAKADGMLFSNKLHAFVEYETIELAEKAAQELNKEGNWRNCLRVRLLRRPLQAKPVQARVKKSGQEDEVIYKEDDTSTSEQNPNPVNEKQLDDTHQQPDVHSHDHVPHAEEHSNEKEGGHKKGRNRGRGKGRGRPQYNHHNNRMVPPPSTNSVTTEHSVIGKQPPGPRMPDGTRGFSMGRGKPITVAINNNIS